MSFHYLSWAVELKGVSPIARLLAIWMGNYARLIDTSGPVPDGKPAWEIDIDRALDWIGCEEEELLASTPELAERGVSPLNLVGRKIQFTFPERVYQEDMRAYKPVETWLSIYVISAAQGVTKIGISQFPERRLAGLQASNPTNLLKLVWSLQDKSTVIRRAERRAHERLAEHAAGNEWFNVSSERAIEVVRSVLEGLGVKA